MATTPLSHSLQDKEERDQWVQAMLPTSLTGKAWAPSVSSVPAFFTSLFSKVVLQFTSEYHTSGGIGKWNIWCSPGGRSQRLRNYRILPSWYPLCTVRFQARELCPKKNSKISKGNYFLKIYLYY